MFWLGEPRGYLSDFVTQLWVRATGPRIDLEQLPWLQGPVGHSRGIGRDYFQRLAVEQGLVIRSGRGLLPDFSGLRGPSCDPAKISRGVSAFYEQTARYRLDAWAEWCGFYRPFGRLLALIFSRRLQQLNIPLSALDTSHGITSEVLELIKPDATQPEYIVWLRHLVRSGDVLYAGSYSLCQLPGYPATCVKVTFPLPNGNATVIMYPECGEDGSLTITSAGKKFGDPGFYFTVHHGGRVWARYVRAMQETIRVYEAANDEVRADHILRYFGTVFLRLHYKLAAAAENPKRTDGAAANI